MPLRLTAARRVTQPAAFAAIHHMCVSGTMRHGVDPDAALVPRLQTGDRAAFALLVRAHHTRLLRLASLFCRSHATAEEVVQDSWVAVITGIGGYSGTSPLRAWLSAIVVNKAKTRAVRDGRSVSFEDLACRDGEGPAVDPGRFAADGHWLERFNGWDGLTPERIAGDRELLAHVAAALDALPLAQRAAILLRDVEGMEPDAICAELGIGEGNLRVLLCRGRARLRDAAALLVGGPA